MKLVTYIRKTKLGYYKRSGILIEKNKILDINICWQIFFEKKGHYNYKTLANQNASYSLSTIINSDPAPLDKLHATLGIFYQLEKEGTLSTSENASCLVELNEVSITNPLDKINCYRDFYVHLKHVEVGFKKRNEEIPKAWFEMPAYYKGPTTGFIGNNEEILWPKYTDILDYELELACIIQKGGKDIKEKDALKHVLGFTILNDISARDIQKKEMSIRLGPSKGKDFCSIIGPVITTIDEFSHKEPELLMRAYINDELWSEGHSQDGNYSFAQMIEHASKDEWLLPTDVLGSGTVGTGCGLELDKWIKPGDTIKLEVEKIGSLINKVGNKEES